ncbi:MAG: hypothetical protein DRP96_07145 [Candidatus Neomarinimicrobiota bacterium]|nr:MAG: hypothetical protein DRP96_07145 [Candidatus Neomarinimicrobiota bacterium]
MTDKKVVNMLAGPGHSGVDYQQIGKGLELLKIRPFFPIWLKQNNLYVNYRITQICFHVLGRTLSGKPTKTRELGTRFFRDKKFSMRDVFRNHPTVKELIIRDDNVQGYYWFDSRYLKQLLHNFKEYEERPDPKPLLKFLRPWLRSHDLYIDKRIFTITKLLFTNTYWDCWTKSAEIAQWLFERKKADIEYLLNKDPILKGLVTQNKSYDRSFSLKWEFRQDIPDNLPPEMQKILLNNFIANHLKQAYRQWITAKDKHARLRYDIIVEISAAALDGESLHTRNLAVRLFNPDNYNFLNDLKRHKKLCQIVKIEKHTSGNHYWFKRPLLEEIQQDFAQKSA